MSYRYLRLFLAAYLLILLSACSTISHKPLSFTVQSSVVASTQQDNFRWPVNIEDLPAIEIAAPQIEVIEKPVPIRALSDRAKVVMSEAEITCMAQAVYFESKSESIQGQQAVAYVVLNRMGHHSFPDSVCGVVYQKGQFSWTKTKTRIRYQQLYEQARAVAIDVMTRSVENPIGESIFFRQHHIAPNQKGQRFISRIGGHRFYAAI